MQRPNIILTGFMGTGKSSTGRVLARRLAYDFVDTDHQIKSQQGRSVAEIFAQDGEAAFRKMEADVAKELAQRQGLVIATGGHMMLVEDNVNSLSKNGLVFCLSASEEEIVKRLSSKAARYKRPLLPTNNLAGFIHKLIEDRSAGYAQFQQIDTTGRRPHQVADAIYHKIRQQS